MPRPFPPLRHTSRIEKSSSERRFETRFNLNQPVKVTLLGDSPAEPIWGETLDVSSSVLSCVTPVRMAVGSLVKLEVDDSMVLGEVRHCGPRQDTSGRFQVGINLEHVLFGWRELYERARELEIVTEEADTLTLVR